jgi:hypothetical protein
MLNVKERPVNRENPYKLVERMADKGVANYIIREELMDKGFSAHQANEIISDMRRVRAENSRNHMPFELDIGQILTILAIIALIFYILVSNLN